MAPVIPALLPLAERARRDAGRDAGGVHRRLRGLLAAVAAPTRRTTASAPGTAPRTIGAISCGGRLRAADEDCRPRRYPDVIGIAVSMAVRRQRQLRHHDQAAARRPRGAKRHDRGACSARRASAPTPRRSKAAAVSSRRFARGTRLERRAVRRSRRAATIWPRSASGRSAIRAAASSTPASTPRCTIRDELGAEVADITAIKAGISKYAANRAGDAVSGQHGGGEVQSAICRRRFARERRAEACRPSSRTRSRIRGSRRWPRMVSVAIDPEFADAHEDYPTRLAVTLKDGRMRRAAASSTPAAPRKTRCRPRRCATSSSTAPRMPAIERPVAEKIAATLDRLAISCRSDSGR